MTALVTAPLTSSPRTGAHSPDQLLDIAHLFAHDWRLNALASISRDHAERHWIELASIPAVQVWAIAWPSGTGTGWHDHGIASGAFVVVSGALVEQAWHDGVRRTELTAGRGKGFGADHVHDVQNSGSELAVSVHAYSPTLTDMTRYELQGGRLLRLGVDSAGDAW